MTYHDSHLMSLIAELKQSRNVRDQREEKMLCVVEGLLQRIEGLEKHNRPKEPMSIKNHQLCNIYTAYMNQVNKQDIGE